MVVWNFALRTQTALNMVSLRKLGAIRVWNSNLFRTSRKKSQINSNIQFNRNSSHRSILGSCIRPSFYGISQKTHIKNNRYMISSLFSSLSDLIAAFSSHWIHCWLLITTLRWCKSTIQSLRWDRIFFAFALYRAAAVFMISSPQNLVSCVRWYIHQCLDYALWIRSSDGFGLGVLQSRFKQYVAIFHASKRIIREMFAH